MKLIQIERLVIAVNYIYLSVIIKDFNTTSSAKLNSIIHTKFSMDISRLHNGPHTDTGIISSSIIPFLSLSKLPCCSTELKTTH